MKGKLVILSGPAGVGKDTVLEAWAAQNANVERVVSYTTRSPRSGEQDGVDYHFVSKDVFEQMVARGDFLEYKLVHGNYYATPLEGMNKRLAEGKITVLKIDVQGAITVMEKRPDALTIFLLPPSEEELEKRIKGRGADSEESVRLRLENAKKEISFCHKYLHKIINDDLAKVVSQLEAICAPAWQAP